jgi:hypothetical protein
MYARPQMTDDQMNERAKSYSCPCCVDFLFTRVHSAQLRFLLLELLQDKRGDEITNTPEHIHNLWLPSQE